MKAQVFGFWDEERIFQYCVVSPLAKHAVSYSPDVRGLGEYIGSEYYQGGVAEPQSIEELFAFSVPQEVTVHSRMVHCLPLQAHECSAFTKSFFRGYAAAGTRMKRA